MTARRRVSVVVTCYQYGRYLTECVESVFAQTHPDVEIVLVDDGSTDETPRVAEALEARSPLPFRLIRQPNSGHPARARNAGIRQATGELILCLDADDKINPEFLARCVAAFDAEPRIGIAYPDQMNFGDREGFEPHPDYDFSKLVQYNFIPPCSVFRRDLWEEVGGIPIIDYEDWNFWITLGERGHTGRHAPGAVWWYRHHGPSRYQGDLARDPQIKANIVLRHPDSYTPEQRDWAFLVLSGDARALEVGGRPGIIPRFTPRVEETPAAAPTGGHEVPDEARRHILFTMYGWAEEGGGTILPRQIAKELRRRGHRVSVVYTPARSNPELGPWGVEESEEDGVALYAIHNRAVAFANPDRPDLDVDEPRTREVAAALIERLHPDVVHYHSLLSFSMGLPARVDAAGIPSVFTSHNYWPVCSRMYLFQADLNNCPGASAARCAACTETPEARDDFARRIETSRTMTARHIDRHLAVSTRVRDLYVAGGHDAARIEVLQQQPETVDAIWNAVGARRTTVERLDRPLRVGFIGSLLTQKGVHVMVRALQAFADGEVEGHVFGGGAPEYVEALKRLDARRRITFHGRYELAALPRHLAEVDVLVVPSVWEDCAPLVVAEGLAARLPVLGARTGGIPDFIEDGVTGFIFERGNAPDLAAAVRRFRDDPALLGRMQRAIAAPRGFQAHVSDLEERYEAVIVARRGATTVDVAWEGDQFVTHSLALINRELCSGLMECGHAVDVVATGPAWDGHGGERRARLAENVRVPDRAEVWVRHQWPPRFDRPDAAKWVMIQPWEFGSLPRDWIAPMSNDVDEIWVPSSFVRDCYVESGVPADRVRVISNGVDVDTFHPEAPPMALPTSKSFKFLFVGGTIRRKGIDVLLQAWLETFTAADDVCLVIKDMGGDSFYRGQTARELIDRVRAHEGSAEVVYIDRDLDDRELAGLYTACDVLVHPYRGEGFGLPMAEAMACGRAPIVTGAGACLDFCDEDVAWLIPAERTELSTDRIGDLVCVQTPFMFEPDRAALGSLMRRARDEHQERAAKGRRARARIAASFTWGHMTDAVAGRLAVLTGRVSGGEPVETRLRRFEECRAGGRLEEAARHLREAVDAHPQSVAALERYADFSRDLGWSEGVVRAVERLERLAPGCGAAARFGVNG